MSLAFTICHDVYGHARSGRRSSFSASVITCLLLVSNRIDDHHQRVSTRHDAYTLVVAQEYKLKVLVVIILSSCNFIKSFIHTYHLVSHSFSISHDVYALVSTYWSHNVSRAFGTHWGLDFSGGCGRIVRGSPYYMLSSSLQRTSRRRP